MSDAPTSPRPDAPVAPRRSIARRLGFAAVALVASLVGLVAALLGALSSDALLAWALPFGAGKAGFVVEADGVRHDLGRELAIEGLVVRPAVADPGAPPLAEIERVALRYALGATITVSLELRAPRIDLAFDEQGELPWLPVSDAAPEPEPEDTGPPPERLIPPLAVTVLLDRLELTGGEVHVLHPPSGSDVEVRGLGLSATADTGRGVADARLEVAAVRYGEAQVGPLLTEAHVDGAEARIAPFDLAVAEGELGLEARWRMTDGDTQALLTLSGLEPAGLLADLGVEAELPSPVDGRVELTGAVPDAMALDVSVDTSFRDEAAALTLRAKASATAVRELALALSWAGLAVDAGGDADLEGKTSDLGLTVRAPDLSFVQVLAPDVDVSGGALDLEARVSGDPVAPRVELTRLALPSVRAYGVALEALGATASFDVPSGALSAQAGIAEVRAQDVGLGAARLDVSGDLDLLRLDLGVGDAIAVAGSYASEGSTVDLDLAIEELGLDPMLAAAGLDRFQGRIGKLAGDVQGPAAELTELRADLVLSGLELTGPGLTVAQPEPMAITLADGDGRVRGVLGVGEGRFAIDAHADLAEERLQADLDGELDLGELEELARAFVPELRQLAGTVDLAAKASGPFADPVVDLGLTLRDVAVAHGEGADGAPLVEAGLPGLDVAVKGAVTALSGSASLADGRVVAAGREIHDLAAELRLDDGRVRLDPARLVVDELAIEATAAFDPEAPGGGAIRAELRTVDGRLEQLGDLQTLGISGPLSLVVDASGSVAAPVATVSLAAPELSAAGAGEEAVDLGALALDARYADDQVTATGALPGGGALDARAGLGAGGRFDATLTIPEMDLTPFIDVLRQKLPEAFRDAAGRLALDATAAGPLDDPAAVTATAELGVLDLTLARTPIRLAEPARVQVADGRFDLERLRLGLGGGFVDLHAAGDAEALRADVDLDLDPATFDPFVAAATLGPGSIRGSIELTRAGEDTKARGRVDVKVSSIEARAYPYPVENLEVALAMDGPLASLESMRAKLGDGSVRAKGSYRLDDGSVSDAKLSFIQLPYRIPDTLRALASGEIRASGSIEEELLIAGTIRIDEMLYEKDVDVAGAALMPLAGSDAKQTAGGGEAPPEILEHIRLDLELQQGDDLRVKNNVARMAIGVDLGIEGTAAAPRLLGQVDVREGTLGLFGRVFEVQQGTIEFNNPVRIDPRVDIETLTVFERRGDRTEVTLRLEGLASEGIALELSSVPSYEDADILYLLATGKTRGEALSTGTSGTGAALAALNLLGGDYAKESLGVDEIGAEETEEGNVKVSVGKQLDERTTVRASREGGQDASTSVSVEYRLTNNALVIAEPKSDGSVQLELQYRLPIQ